MANKHTYIQRCYLGTCFNAGHKAIQKLFDLVTDLATEKVNVGWQAQPHVVTSVSQHLWFYIPVKPHYTVQEVMCHMDPC